MLLNQSVLRPDSLTYPDLHVISCDFDVVGDTIGVMLSSLDAEIVEVQQLRKDGTTALLTSFPGPPNTQILLFKNFVDTATLVFVFGNGDIITAAYDEANPDADTTTVAVVGSIDCGLLAAEWATDEETLALLTCQHNLVLLSRQLDPISEKQLDPADIKISDAKHVSVGWGKEETQFKGKGAKALERERDALMHAGLDLKEDTELHDPTVAATQRGILSAFDDGLAKISWRGDSEFFAVTTSENVEVESTGESYPRRVIRVFSRDGELDSVSEAVDGIEHNLAWRPMGSLIASTQRTRDSDGDEVLNVAFFERNGLRHGEFNSRLDPASEAILDIQWSTNSDALALRMEDRIQVWTTKNYHWYLKHEMFVNQQDRENKVSFIKFHPEDALKLMVGTTNGSLHILSFAYQIARGPMTAENGQGMVMVVDGSEIKMTPLAVANVPPPIAYREYDLPSNICHVATNHNNQTFAFVTSTGNVYLTILTKSDMSSHKVPEFLTISKDELGGPGALVKQVAFSAPSIFVVLIDTEFGSQLSTFDVSDVAFPISEIQIELKAVLLKSTTDGTTAAVQCADGTVMAVSEVGEVFEVGQFPRVCVDFAVVRVGEKLTSIGLTAANKLYVGDAHVASAVTSFITTDELLAYTTQSQLFFVHLSQISDPQSFSTSIASASAADERIRDIERGSIIVSCFPSKSTLVLQAPRGNIETIYPRILVVAGVRNHIRELRYYDAFVTCRTHRIDLDLLHDFDPEQFLRSTELFVQQIGKIEYLDLFVSCLHDENVAMTKYKDTLQYSEVEGTVLKLANVDIDGRKMIRCEKTQEASAKVNQICEAILRILAKPEYEKTYLQTRITAYACQKPSNLTGAMELICSLQSEAEVESAVAHLSFLLDVNKLYNHALALYNVKLALTIAQKSQMDPKEYLPFLQNLHTQPELRRQFLIDDHLKNFSKALKWLYDMKAEDSEEFEQYMVKHALYKRAQTICRYDEAMKRKVLVLYAQHLLESKCFSEAALAFEHLGMMEDALEAYVTARRSREAISTAKVIGDDKLVTVTAERLSELLEENHDYAEAAIIEVTYLKNVERAVLLYCKGYKYADAILTAIGNNKPEFVLSVVDEQLGSGFGVIAELVADCKGQTQSQLKRLRELRAKKSEDPFAFYGTNADDLDTPDNVSVAQSETSTTPSFFTRYTGKTAGTAKTGASRKTQKNRKREERKRAKGRKGTIYEEEYLIRSIGRLIERLQQTQSDAVHLLEGLVRRHMIQQAYQIQNEWVDVVEFLKNNIEEIHNMSERDRERVNEDGEVYLIDVIPKPAIPDFPSLEILDF